MQRADLPDSDTMPIEAEHRLSSDGDIANRAALDHFVEQIQAASRSGHGLYIRGGGSKSWYGRPVAAGSPSEVLDMRAYRGIIDYDPSELVLSARAGTPLDEIERTLDEANQMLAFEPPRFGGAATLGGCVAAGLSGPRRMASGAVRDVVLGVAILNGAGAVLYFGGQVVKNVAGYDVSRLMAGSLGTLGPLLEMSIRTIPRPAAEVTRALDLSLDRALQALNEWALAAWPITASAWHAGRLTVRLGGATAAVRSACTRLGGEVVQDDADFWRAIRDHRHPFFRTRPSDCALWRVALPPTAAFDIDAADAFVEWGGAQRWYHYRGDEAALRADAVARGGHATRYHPRTDTAPGSDADAIDMFTRPAPALMAIQQRLKQVFDPAGIFNRGRCFADF